ncbi:hypothetical protein JCM10908_007156 [Rhodotorula pacifica]|uniref:uncharacterized protein n=1 Tax=Rhodotorula pacifica TaxID=1495444 RepID=UPI00317CC2C0
MHTARASYAVQHDYQGQYAALPPHLGVAVPEQQQQRNELSPAAALVDNWRNKHAVVGSAEAPIEDSMQSQDPSSYRRHRSPNRYSKASSHRPPSSSNVGASSSLLSLEQPYYAPGQQHYNQHQQLPYHPPASVATSVESSYKSSSHLPYYPPSTTTGPPHPTTLSSQRSHPQHHPGHAYHQASRYSAPPPQTTASTASRSQQSVSQPPQSNGSSSRHTRQHRGGDRDSASRHHHASYDADYDRQLAASSGAATSSSSAARGLFDPRAAVTGSSTSKRTTNGTASPHRRSQPGEPRSRTRHGSSTTSTVHSPAHASSSATPTMHVASPAPPYSSQADGPPASPRSAARRPAGSGGAFSERSARPPSRGDERRPPPARSKREPVQLVDLGRRAGTTATNAGTSSRYQQQQHYGDAKDSRESLESVGTDFSGRTKSSGAAGGGRRRRRAAEGEGDEDGGGDLTAGAGSLANAQGGKNRQLFDPRKDDPMRFAAAAPRPGPGSVASGPAATTASNGKSGVAFPPGLTGSTFTLQTESVMNFAGQSDAFGGADDASSVHTSSQHAPAASTSGKRPDHPILAELKKAYRGILELEKKLQDENRKAAKDVERAAENAAAGVGAGGLEGPGNGGVQIQGQGKNYDDEYWVKLAKAHKQLAEAHYSFLQMSLDPHIPAGLHSLPQRYNIPTRLWQVAFHQLLERMRHAVVSAPPPSSSTSAAEPETNVLDHLIEFIQFAYTHYSQLFEDPAVAVFRAAWIEQLGDLARYRMAVAGLASRVHATQAGAPSSASVPNENDPLDDLELDADQGGKRPSKQAARPADAASIGQAALNDWDLEEQETWREMAREWYALGLAESPGTGRLQHHLALLSKGDELRALYHYSKSLTTAHPYLSARESILPLFEEEHQARRTQSDVSQHELFVHLHGMLFTKISLDDFDECLERFLERLRQEGWALKKARDEHAELDQTSSAFGDREWCMLGIINIAALLQYGAEDGVLRKLMTPDGGDKAEATSGAPTGSSKRHASRRHESPRGQADKSRSMPQALMLKRADGESPAITDNLEDDGSELGFEADDVVKQLQPASATEPEDDPLPFKLAQRLAFSILSTVLEMPFFRIGSTEVPNPYVTILCTFLAHLSHQPAAMRHLERSVPWDALAAVFNRVSAPVEIRLETPNKLVGGKPLPEDHCLRGMEWAGRQLFGRGYWREPRSRSNAASPASGLGDVGAPPIESLEGTTMRVENEADALRFDLAALHGGPTAEPGTSGALTDEDAEEGGHSVFGNAATVLSEGRWRRLAICAAWLVRNVPGFDYDFRAADPRQRFRVSGALRQKLDRWQREDDDAREAERLSRLALDERTANGTDEGSTDGDESDEEDFEDENDSDEVKELKARRRQLKSIIRQARAATRAPRRQKGGSKVKLGGKASAIPHVFPGYTVLVFDTNILLTSITLLSELVAAECWTIVVPLAVITELDGLKRNSTPLGIAADEAIDYLEQAVRGYSRYLKVQTSRGNYLKDLSIRNESIDFDGADPASSHGFARSLDDVILRAASWQKDHFSNRLALVNPRAVAEKRKVPSDTAPVVLITFDRNLRLKASARGVDATDEKGLKKAIDAVSRGGG